jgi:hypothetical protein
MDMHSSPTSLPNDTVISGSVKGGHYEFPLRVQTRVHMLTGRVQSYGIRLGGHVHSIRDDDVCIFLTITAPPPPMQPEDALLPRYGRDDEHKVASIVHIHYNECCAAGRTLHKGGGTAVMLRAACTYAVRVFPWVTSFSLSDKSYFAIADGLHVPLPSYSLCTSGATWYEREFGAHLRGVATHQEYRSLVEWTLQNPKAKIQMGSTVAELCSKAGVQVPDLDCCCLETCYASAPTLKEFFCVLKEACPREEFCRLVQRWVDNLMKKWLRGMHHKEWMVTVDSFLTNDIEVGHSSTGAHRGDWDVVNPIFMGMMILHPIEDAD